MHLEQDCALFLDFDGTLVDLVATPHEINVPLSLLDDLANLSDALDGALTCITGRSWQDIHSYLGNVDMFLVGSHGVEFLQPAVSSAHWLKLVQHCQAALHPWPLAHVEHKPLGMALHWRQAPEAESHIRTLARDMLEDAPAHRMIEGQCVLEIQPAHTHKGLALRQLMKQPPFAGRTPVFIGDDLTDIPAMQTAQALGGYAMAVGPRTQCHANAMFNRAADVRRWLHLQAERLSTVSSSASRH
ncbi:MAG: trehalose-phosphatase [Comamonas sp.]